MLPTVDAPTGTEAPHRTPGVRAADPESILELQRTAGNRAVVGLVTGNGTILQRAPNEDVPDVGGPSNPTDLTAEQLGIVPGSALDTPRGRANRAEQLRRAAEHAVDQTTVQAGSRPDSRARARAADYTPLYFEWTKPGTDRRARIESIINAHLAREGIPPVRVVFGGSTAGRAQFAADMWTLALSRAVINANTINERDFAALVDNAVHETQHVVTTFRGIRVALARNTFNNKAYIHEGIVDQARAANQRRHPNKELDKNARKEAYEIYQVSVEPDRARGMKVPAGGVNREAVLARKEAADRARSEAAAILEVVREEAARHPNNRAWANDVVKAQADLKTADRELTAAHNAYISLPEETFSWRGGSAARAAVLERIAVQERLHTKWREATAAAAEHLARLKQGDLSGAAAASRRSREAQVEAAAARRQLAALTNTEPQMVAGRREIRGLPLTQSEIANAPKAPPADPAQAPTPGAPRPAESAPLSSAPTSTRAAGGTRAQPDAAKAAAVIDPGPAPTSSKRTVVAAPGGGIVGAGGRTTETTTTGDTSKTVTTTGGAGLTKEGVEAKFGRTEQITTRDRRQGSAHHLHPLDHRQPGPDRPGPGRQGRHLDHQPGGHHAQHHRWRHRRREGQCLRGGGVRDGGQERHRRHRDVPGRTPGGGERAG